MQGILENQIVAVPVNERGEQFLGKKIGFLTSILGCRHKRLTRPISAGNDTYRSCTECGARRKFDAEGYRTFGPYYYPPSSGVR